MEIYKATNKINGDSYIGYATKGLEERKPKHYRDVEKGSTVYFHNALRDYGFENFSWIILEHNVSDFEILKSLETYWIREFDTKRPCGYNLTDGGDGSVGYKQSESHRRKIGEANKGRKFPNRKGKISYKHSNETKKKIGEANKGKKQPKTIKMIENWKKSFIGYKQSEEHKRKISESLLVYNKMKDVSSVKENTT